MCVLYFDVVLQLNIELKYIFLVSGLFIYFSIDTETYEGLNQNSKMKLFENIRRGLKSLRYLTGF